MKKMLDPLNNTVVLQLSTLRGHIYRRHPILKGKEKEIIQTVENPDNIAKSKKDGKSLLYFRKMTDVLILMVVASPEGKVFTIRTSFYVFNTSKGDPIIWHKKIST